MIRLPWRKRVRSPARFARRRTFRPTFEALEDRNLLSNAIVAENLLQGTPQSVWDVPGAGDATIQGFASDISVNQGQTISFKINDTASAPYHIDIYRVGYYQGLGARVVSTIPSSQTLDVVQPTRNSTRTRPWSTQATGPSRHPGRCRVRPLPGSISRAWPGTIPAARS
jgi:hypothetical protein